MKYLTSIFLYSTTLMVSSYALIDQIAIRQAQAQTQMASVGTLPKKIERIGLEFAANREGMRYGKYEFCSTKFRTGDLDSDDPWPDPACNEKSNATRVDESAVPVEYIAWGFVLDGTEATRTYNKIYNITPGTNSFSTINNNSETFGDHLCVEVHFKDTSQFESISAALNNKTVVFCAESNDTSNALVDIDMIDSDNDGLNNPDHATIAGWRCYNPHNSLNNGGLGLGYIELNEQAFRLIVAVGNIFDQCFPALSHVSN